MRFEVPQFIDIEDKIFGPFTWRQFLYLGGGIGFAVALFLFNGLLFILLGLPVAILAGALAFYPVNNRPFSFFLESIITYFKGQRLYLWRKNENTTYSNYTPSSVSQKTKAAPEEVKSAGNISSLSRKLELQALQKTE